MTWGFADYVQEGVCRAEEPVVGGEGEITVAKVTYCAMAVGIDEELDGDGVDVEVVESDVEGDQGVRGGHIEVIIDLWLNHLAVLRAPKAAIALLGDAAIGRAVVSDAVTAAGKTAVTAAKRVGQLVVAKETIVALLRQIPRWVEIQIVDIWRLAKLRLWLVDPTVSACMIDVTRRLTYGETVSVKESNKVDTEHRT